MKLKNKTLIILLSLGLIACGNQSKENNNQSKEESVATENTEENTEAKSEDNSEENNQESENESEDKNKEESSVDKDLSRYEVNLAILKGPTSAGAINMIDWSNREDYNFAFRQSVEGAPDAVIPKLVSGEADMAIIPANLASAVYNKTEGKIKVLAINNLGVLYLVESKDIDINSIDDLVNSGETIYASGKGATPDIAIKEVLKANGYKEDDLKIEFLSEASEVAQKMISGQAKVALLPEPMATSVLMKADGAKVALDINDLYEKATDSPLISAVLVARSEYLEDIDVDLLLETYKQSIEEATNDIDNTARLLEEYDIMPEAIAKKAMDKFALKYIDGEKMQTMMQKHLEDLYNSNPQLVGGSLPEDDFYYQK